MTSKKQIVASSLLQTPELPQDLMNNIIHQIEQAKSRVASYTNSTLVMLYWQIGFLINQEILDNKRAEYGQHIISQMARKLSTLYGNGFDFPNLSRMVKFSRLYPDQQIMVTLSQQLSWSHIIRLIVIENGLERDFYSEICRLERWSVRTLRQKIDNMLYQRTAISKRPETVIATELDKLKAGDLNNPDLYLQDPYILSFLKNGNISSEYDLEQAILNELQLFIQELGSDFCFVARQKRMSTQNNDRYLDLLL